MLQLLRLRPSFHQPQEWPCAIRTVPFSAAQVGRAVRSRACYRLDGAMSWKQTLQKESVGHWVLPKTKTMRCDAHLFLSDKLLEAVEEDVFQQIVNACTFPGATRVVLTPDCHVGY